MGKIMKLRALSLIGESTMCGRRAVRFVERNQPLCRGKGKG